MALKATYFDVLEGMRPYLVRAAEADVVKLRASTDDVAPVWSADDYDSSLGVCLETLDEGLVADAVARTGLSEETVRATMPQVLPMMRAQMASLYHTVNHEFHSAVNFMLFGKKVFHFSDNLSSHLAHTEINVRADLIHLPFPSCLFVFTSPEVIRAMYSMHLGENSPSRDATTFDYSAPVSVFLSMHAPRSGLPGRHLVLTAWHARPPARSYMMLKRELYLDDEWTLEQVLRTNWEKLTPDAQNEGLFVGDGVIENCDDDKFYTDGLSFYRIVMNAVLYLSSVDCEVEQRQSLRTGMEQQAASTLSRPKRKQLLKDAKQVSGLDYSEVGASMGSIVVDPARPKAGADSDTGAGQRLQVRFMVRGHWRQQPHGPQGRDRKLLWIRPHYKGPELGALINRPYRVVRSESQENAG